MRIREAPRLAAEERLHARVRRHGQIVAVALEPIAWQHDAVVAIAADEAAGVRPLGLTNGARAGS